MQKTKKPCAGLAGAGPFGGKRISAPRYLVPVVPLVVAGLRVVVVPGLVVVAAGAAGAAPPPAPTSCEAGVEPPCTPRRPPVPRPPRTVCGR